MLCLNCYWLVRVSAFFFFSTSFSLPSFFSSQRLPAKVFSFTSPLRKSLPSPSSSQFILFPSSCQCPPSPLPANIPLFLPMSPSSLPAKYCNMDLDLHSPVPFSCQCPPLPANVPLFLPIIVIWICNLHSPCPPLSNNVPLFLPMSPSSCQCLYCNMDLYLHSTPASVSVLMHLYLYVSIAYVQTVSEKTIQWDFQPQEKNEI